VGYGHAQVEEVSPNRAAPALARHEIGCLPGGYAPAVNGTHCAAVAFAEERRRVPSDRTAVRGPARLGLSAGSRCVLRHDHEARTERGRFAGESAR